MRCWERQFGLYLLWINDFGGEDHYFRLLDPSYVSPLPPDRNKKNMVLRIKSEE